MADPSLLEPAACDNNHAHLMAELKAFSNGKFEENATRMEALELKLGQHKTMLEKTTHLTAALNDRFDSFESVLNTERRNKDDALAQSLNEWKSFSILKFDESTARQGVIEDNQTKHMKATDELHAGIGEVLSIVSALSGAKKTVGWLGKGAIWLGALAAAWVAVRTALMSDVKVWPFS